MVSGAITACVKGIDFPITLSAYVAQLPLGIRNATNRTKLAIATSASRHVLYAPFLFAGNFLRIAAELSIDNALADFAAIALHTTGSDTLVMELVMLGLHDCPLSLLSTSLTDLFYSLDSDPRCMSRSLDR